MGQWGYYEYVPVARKREKAAKELKALTKKHNDIQPVVVAGTSIAKTWWAKAWNKNLVSYADYSNRIGRGRSYLKNGMVLDLKILEGKVTALVSGSGKPYHVSVSIDPLESKKWNDILKTCGNQLDSMEVLAEGKFPKELAEIFTLKGSGLFPSPKEIGFSCSCPDGAYMCKHVSAVLFGIGVRFDEDPLLFFKLRQIDVEMLIKKSIDEKMKNMLENVGKKSERVLEDVNLGELFGIYS